MALVTVKADVDEAVRNVRALQEDQLPYIIARSLTAVAQEGQKAARVLENQVFKLRNDWTVRQTKITPATKQRFIAEVYTDTENRKSGAGDYLPGQQDGREKVPVGGHQHIAIPTRYLRRIAPGVIPDALRPAKLLPPDAKLGEAYTGSFKAPGTRPRRALGRESRKRLGSSDFVAFLQHTHGGSLCVFVRHGGISFHGGSQDAEPFYVLVRSAEIRPRFPMEVVVEEAVRREFPEIFQTVAEQVGVSVKL